MLPTVYIIYFIFLGCGLTGSSGVIGYLLYISRGRFNSNVTLLVLCLHISLVLENVASIPLVFTGAACQFMSFLFFYSGVANIITMLLMALSYRYLLLEDVHEVGPKIRKYSMYLIWGLPLITLLPFSTNSFAKTDGDWCVPDPAHTSSNIWTWCVFLVWIYICLLIIWVAVIDTARKVQKVDEIMMKRFIRSVGLYILVSALCWTVRSVFGIFRIIKPNNIRPMDAFIIYFPIAVSGVFYFLIFLTEVSALHKVEGGRERDSSVDLTDASYGIRIREPDGGTGAKSVDWRNSRASMDDNSNEGDFNRLRFISWEQVGAMSTDQRRSILATAASTASRLTENLGGKTYVDDERTNSMHL